MILFPPQFYLLAELARHKDYRTLLDADAGNGVPVRVKEREVRPLEPRLRRVRDEGGQSRLAMTLPGDEDYDEHEGAASETAGHGRRHRTYIVDEEVVKGKPLGMVVMGVHRRAVGEVMGRGDWSDLSEGDCGQNERETSATLAKL